MEFRILGPLDVTADGTAPDLGSPKQRALLAFLLLHEGELVSRDRLIDALWAEQPPRTAAHAVAVYVARLRKALAGAEVPAKLETRGSGYVLEVGPDGLDAARFERLRAEGRQALDEGAADVAAAKLREALSLWRGPALAEFAYEPFAQEEIARLEELRLAALEDRIDADLALARHDELVPELEKLVAEHPLRERFRGQLMLALYRAGRQADALAVYRQTHRLLRDELGLEPAPFLRELESAILRQDAQLAVEAPDVRSRRHMPAFATDFVGREREIDEVVELLHGDVRLLTLTGPGGIGKTRLAVQAASAVAGRFADGVFFVDLAPVRDEGLVAPTIAHAVGVHETAGAPAEEALARHLEERRLLLVLDNFEQVDAAAPLVGSLLRAAGGLKVLVTSRAALRLYGEAEFPVPPLPVEAPAGTPEAVALFAARAGAVRRGFDVTGANAAAVVEICRRLDGLPLAIELAAARSRELAPEQMLSVLPKRLELASEGPRDVPARQQTMRAALEWSHDLLSGVERDLFARLAVFAGGWTKEAASAVLRADERTVRPLVRWNLVVEQDGRFGMLETIREYAAERLGELPHAGEARERHAEYFCELAEQSEDNLVQGIDDAGELDALELEHDNFRAALRWLHETGRLELELRLGAALRIFWWVRGYLTEGRRWLEAALANSGDAPRELRAKALGAAGVLAYKQADYPRAQALWEEALPIYRSLGDEMGVARSVGELGGIAAAAGEYERAAELYEESRELYSALGEPSRLATVLSNLGDIAFNQGDYETAMRRCEEALALQRELNDKDGASVSLFNLSRAALGRGREREAAAALGESLRLAREIGFREVVAYCLAGLAGLASARGDHRARVARIVGAAERLFGELGATPQGRESELFERAVEELRAGLGDDPFVEAHAEGMLEVEQAMEEAQALADELSASERVA